MTCFHTSLERTSTCMFQPSRLAHSHRLNVLVSRTPRTTLENTSLPMANTISVRSFYTVHAPTLHICLHEIFSESFQTTLPLLSTFRSPNVSALETNHFRFRFRERHLWCVWCLPSVEPSPPSDLPLTRDVHQVVNPWDNGVRTRWALASAQKASERRFSLWNC